MYKAPFLERSFTAEHISLEKKAQYWNNPIGTEWGNGGGNGFT